MDTNKHRSGRRYARDIPYPIPRRSFLARALAREAAETSLELVGGKNYLLGGVDASYREFVRTASRVTGGRAPRFATPYPLLWLRAHSEVKRAAREIAETGGVLRPPAWTPEMARLGAATMQCDSSLAERDLDYRSDRASLEQMIEQSFRWLQAAAPR